MTQQCTVLVPLTGIRNTSVLMIDEHLHLGAPQTWTTYRAEEISVCFITPGLSAARTFWSLTA